MITVDANNENIKTLEQIRLNFVYPQAMSSSNKEFEVKWTIAVSQIENIDIKKEFQHLVKKWINETIASSSPLEKIANDNYLEIIKLGGAHREVVLQLIFQELNKKSDFWFKALKHISGENPVKPEEFSSYKLVKQAWLNWGKEKGYL